MLLQINFYWNTVAATRLCNSITAVVLQGLNWLVAIGTIWSKTLQVDSLILYLRWMATSVSDPIHWYFFFHLKYTIFIDVFSMSSLELKNSDSNKFCLKVTTNPVHTLITNTNLCNIKIMTMVSYSGGCICCLFFVLFLFLFLQWGFHDNYCQNVCFKSLCT